MESRVDTENGELVANQSTKLVDFRRKMVVKGFVFNILKIKVFFKYRRIRIGKIRK